MKLDSSVARQLRSPRVVGLERRRIQHVLTGSRGKRFEVERWYVTLRFGGVEKKLAVSAEVVAWMRRNRR